MAQEGFFNQQEVNMTYYNDEHAAAHADGFIALAVAEDAAVAVGELMQGLPASLRCFQDQAVRAAASVALNVAEGSGRRGRERKRFYQVAHASAREAKSAVRIVVRLNAIDQARGPETVDLLDRAATLTWRLWTGSA